jgi:3-oxoacyl-[acyl-carrier protein] reductase
MRNVIVTGGSRGLGLAIARKLCAAEYRVIALARNETPELAQTPQGAGGEWHFRACDLNELATIAPLIKSIRKEFGPIYGLVNNAGIGTHGLLASMSIGDIERLVRLNTVSPIITTKSVVRAMMLDGGGRIVNIASIVGFTGFSGLSVYSATKASMIGFTKSLARELGVLGINVNAIAPGFVATDLTQSLGDTGLQKVVRRSPLGRLAEAGDIADAAEFLLSEKSRSITGTMLTVDAGGTA